MAVWVQIYYLWGGSMFLLHVCVCMRLAQERLISIRAWSLESPFAGRRQPWRGKVASLATTPLHPK